MQLTPVYGDQPILEMDPFLGNVGIPMLRQRNRLADLVGGFDAGQWASPTRCEGWSVQDVIAHLVTVNQFWSYSISAGLKGTPTEVLATFDPVASPAQMVAAVRSKSTAETLDEFVASNVALGAVIDGIDEAGWEIVAEAPPGHISVRCVVLHGLWDGWIHERDIALPLGLTVAQEPDEIAGALAYAAALGPGFAAMTGTARTGVLVVSATDPEVRIVAELGDHVRVHAGTAPDDAIVLAGDAVELVEALSLRGPLTADLADEDRWVLGRLDEVFDQAP